VAHELNKFQQERRWHIIDGKVDKREEGYKVAESRSIDDVAQKLVEAYKEVLEI